MTDTIIDVVVAPTGEIRARIATLPNERVVYAYARTEVEYRSWLAGPAAALEAHVTTQADWENIAAHGAEVTK